VEQTRKGRALAAHLHNTMPQARCGAFVRGEELVIFGNDGYEKGTKDRARREVEAVVAWAREMGLEVTDFGTSEGGYSWALVCLGLAHTPDQLAGLAFEAEDMLRKAWNGDNTGPEAQCFERVQRGQTTGAFGKCDPAGE
jgi:hypothetical protein